MTGNKIKEFRIKSGLTQEMLAEKSGVTATTVGRWETNTSRPSHLAIEALKKIGMTNISEADSNKDTLSRVDYLSEDELLHGLKSKFKVGTKSTNIKLSPYVINGPKDQLDFYHTLLEMQEEGISKNPQISLERLSLVSEFDDIKTNQFLLEKPKKIAKSWSSNYGSHGWHRYIGRFPPHLVRSLINYFSLDSSSTILDPFCGSGTTLVEGKLLGIDSIGVDICPLSALISRAKSAFPSETQQLENAIEEYKDFYSKRIANFREINGAASTHKQISDYFNDIIPYFTNLEKWFSLDAYLGTCITVEFIKNQQGYLQDFFATQLSSAMRSIGNVEVNVVRAEYSKSPRENVDVLDLVLKRSKKSLASINNSIKSHDLQNNANGSPIIYENGVQNAPIKPNSIDAIITSPPYGVESISYLRTHLLSYRSLASILLTDPYTSNTFIIGSEYLNQDVNVNHKCYSISKTYKAFFDEMDDKYTTKKHRVRIEMMKKFFDDMCDCAESFNKWLKPNGKLAFVVGNKKIADDVIPTHEIMKEVFSHYKLEETKLIKHKLKTNNSNSQVPWQDKIIQDEYIMIMEKSC